jgi:hypothetical protein
MGRFWGWILRGRSQKISGKGIALPERFFEWFMQKFWVKITLIIIYLGLKKGAETKTNIAY